MNFDDQSPELKRRIEFLLNEARCGARRDQVITYIMRVLTNYASVREDASSSRVKERNQNVSEKAFNELLAAPTFDAWIKMTINEHQKPLKLTWQWLLENAATLRPNDVWDVFVKNPYVTVLKSEDLELTKSGLQSEDGPKLRYATVNIKVLRLPDTPRAIWRQKKGR